MDFVLVFPLILALLATGQSDTELNSCFVLCPPGYHKVGSCDDPDAKHRCGKCEHNTFTEIENSTPKCRRCDSCDHYEVEIKPCVFNSNVVCDCKEGYYYKGSGRRRCQQCPCESPFGKEASNKRECDCGSCLSDPQCKRKCVGCTILSPTNATTAPSATPVPSIEATSTESMSPKNLSPWLFFLLVVVAFLVLFWLLLHFTEKSVRYPDSCPCWGANKDPELPAEDPKCNEQGSHQDSTSTTMISNTSEGTPMLNPSPAKPEHPVHITPLLPGAEHRAVKQDEQSEQWPAIVLYTIIKEVPLRRWKEFLRLLSVADQQLERVELEAGLGQGSMERQYQMLRLWSQCSSASLSDVFSALHHMDLSGCAQLLQESLEKLQWWPELEQGFTDHGSNGSTQYT